MPSGSPHILPVFVFLKSNRHLCSRHKSSSRLVALKIFQLSNELPKFKYCNNVFDLELTSMSS